MTIYKTAYDTTLGSITDTKAVNKAIVESFIKDELYKENLGVDNSLLIKPVYITGYHDSEQDIPLFAHPIIVHHKGTDYLCSDIRLYISTKEYKESKDIGASIRNRVEYNFIKSLSVISLAWLTGSGQHMRDNLKFAGVVYAVNISEAITRAYSLDATDRLKLNVISLTYYRSLYLSDKDMSDNEKQVAERESAMLQSMISFGISERFFNELITDNTVMRSTEDYINTIKKALDNTRLSSLNMVVLLTLIKNSWYGNNAKEYISVSLEYPPVWLAIVYTALNERTYKNSMVYKIAERLKKGSSIETFNKSYEEFITRYNIGVSLEDQMLALEADALKFDIVSEDA